MKFPIAAQLKQPGLPGRYEGEEALDPQPYMGGEVALAAPLHVTAEYVYDGESLAVKGAADTVLRSSCALCAKAFDEPFRFEFEERFVKAPGPEDECYPMGSEELDITKAVVDNLFLNLPLRSLCREDCKGLCPVCGCDLNQAQCACAPPEGPERENPFAALGALLNHDKEV